MLTNTFDKRLSLLIITPERVNTYSPKLLFVLDRFTRQTLQGYYFVSTHGLILFSGLLFLSHRLLLCLLRS